MSLIASLKRLLSPDELIRMERLRFAIDQHRFVVAHGSLRLILSRYLGLEGAAVQFTYGAYGKPSMKGSDLAFNFTHSEEMALCAVGRRGPIGVDIEKRRPLPDAERIAEHFFCERERVALRRLPPREQEEAFFRCWTRKEAYVKAVGQGLAAPLASFAVTLAPDEPCRLCWVASDPDAATQWTVCHLEPDSGYVGALVSAGRPRRIQRWNWNFEPSNALIPIIMGGTV